MYNDDDTMEAAARRRDNIVKCWHADQPWAAKPISQKERILAAARAYLPDLEKGGEMAKTHIYMCAKLANLIASASLADGVPDTERLVYLRYIAYLLSGGVNGLAPPMDFIEKVVENEND